MKAGWAAFAINRETGATGTCEIVSVLDHSLVALFVDQEYKLARHIPLDETYNWFFFPTRADLDAWLGGLKAPAPPAPGEVH